jgi:RNA polymerase sigma-70 factor, ECF subfamily
LSPSRWHAAAVDAEPDPARGLRFERVVGSVYEPIQRFLLRRTDPATADDVLGDVLLVLWRRLDDVPDGEPLPWSYGIARGCLANARRSAARQERLAERIAHERPVEPADDDRLADALGALPEDDRELLRLWAWEQLPPREIAVVLGVSANAATIRLHRAKRRLKNLLLTGKDAHAPGHERLREGGGAR